MLTDITPQDLRHARDAVQLNATVAWPLAAETVATTVPTVFEPLHHAALLHGARDRTVG